MINTMARAGKAIAHGLSNAEMDEMVGAAGHDNKSGDHVQKLDIFAEETIERYAAASGLVSCMASEESEGLIGIPKGYKSGAYVLMFDPLDGSSNINVNITVGTIWAVRLQTAVESSAPENYLQRGKTLQAAGYMLYGARTQFVYSAWNGVHIFTLSPASGEFILTHRSVKIPLRGKVYSTNEGNTKSWSEGVKRYVQHLKDGDHVGRCSGAMVADFHRILLGGGIFFYPNYKLRLLYEAAPIAFLADQAGGSATDGAGNILDIIPTSIHEKVPLIFGSREDVQEYLEITGPQK
jgi:fructose-1,6-bisphosphatase I